MLVTVLNITIFYYDYDYDACVTRDKALHIIGVAGLLKEFEKNPSRQVSAITVNNPNLY